jgi:hypothetical protein
MTEQAVTETIVDITSAAKGANFLPWLIAPLNNVRKNRSICGQRPSAAKAGLILWNLTARLEATPFQNGLQNCIYPQAVKRCATHGL